MENILADGAHLEASHKYMIPILSLVRFPCRCSFSCRKDIRIPQVYYTYYDYYEEALVVSLMTRILRKRHISDSKSAIVDLLVFRGSLNPQTNAL